MRMSMRTIAGLAALTAAISGCVPNMEAPLLNIPAREQEVPVVVAIGPIDTSKVAYDGQPVSQFTETALQETLLSSLKRTQLFKDVVVLKLADSKADAEGILSAARQQQADLLLTGEVKEFEADVPTIFGSRYEVGIRLLAQLYNAHTGTLVWKKTERVDVAKDASGWSKVESLDTIVRNIALPSATAGLLPPMVDHLQKEYLTSLRAPGKGAIGESAIFGGAELAKIDAELAPPVTAMPVKDHAYAVVMGVEDYRDLPRVDYAKRDAEMIKQYLVRSLGYREQNVVLLLNDRATKSGLEARIEKWLPKQVAAHPDAEVFVYYGGHGAPDVNTNEAFLVPYDGDPAFLESTGYPVKRLYQLLSQLPVAQVTVVMDSCFSGAGGRSVIAKGTRPMLIKVDNPLLASPNMLVISAAGGNQISSAMPEKRHGLFTYYFLKGLQGEADVNKDGAVDVEELFGYIRPNVETEARRMNAEQSPQLLPGTDLLGERAKLHVIEFRK